MGTTSQPAAEAPPAPIARPRSALTLARVAPGPGRHGEVRRRRVRQCVVVSVRVRVGLRRPVMQQRVHVHVLVRVRRRFQAAAVRWRRRREARGAPGQAALELEGLQLEDAQVLLTQSLLLAPFEAAAQEAAEAAQEDDEPPDKPETSEAREERVGALGHNHGGGAGGGSSAASLDTGLLYVAPGPRHAPRSRQRHLGPCGRGLPAAGPKSCARRRGAAVPVPAPSHGAGGRAGRPHPGPRGTYGTDIRRGEGALQPPTTSLPVPRAVPGMPPLPEPPHSPGAVTSPTGATSHLEVSPVGFSRV